MPDIGLINAAAKAGAFSVLHLGRIKTTAESALAELAKQPQTFGICATGQDVWDMALPSNVCCVILPWGTPAPENPDIEIVWQTLTAADAEAALAAGAKTLILKGAESGGFSGSDSAFILFQRLIATARDAQADIFVQGGIGIHTAAAYMALGAAGIILDSQVALFPECSLPQAHKSILGRLSGNEIRVCEGFHYHIPPGQNALGPITDLDSLFAQINAPDSKILPLGQDIVIAADLVDEYKRLKYLVRALGRTVADHVRQAQITDAFATSGKAAGMLGCNYPVVQGPMARISDSPRFLKSVAAAGGLPILAMSMMQGNAAGVALAETDAALEGMPWGVGILGFAYPQMLEEQIKLIIEAKPPFVLIAGGRAEQAKAFAKADINVLLHAPTPGALEMFLKENLSGVSYVFEGRESGGHVGPLFSAVLWEKQVNKILKQDNPTDVSVLFAGGIHDAFSALFVRILAAPLSARGVPIGLQCGTVYLYTKESVADGAISELYQKQIIEKSQTLLLRSGTGQETRCVSSPFTDFFLEEKARMEADGLPTVEILQKLEDLNLGRLRIASKGQERVGSDIVSLTEAEQLQRGLFMTGAVTEFIANTTTIAEVHEQLTAGSLQLLEEITLPDPADTQKTREAYPHPDIAVIGMAGIFPEATSVDEFWRNIVFGKDCIREVPDDRWSTDIFYRPDSEDSDHVVCKWGGFLSKTDFDVMEFGIAPQSMTSIEAVQLLALLIAKRALQDAGIDDPASADLENTTVIFGAEGAGELTSIYGFRTALMATIGELPNEVESTLPQLTEDSFPGILSNVISGRISNRLNTRGRNFTVDAACASSLAAMDIAVGELRSGKADMVVLGGADLHDSILDFLLFNSTYALSAKGRCATFDSEADGTVISESVSAMVLKRREDAERDGDRIYAVIKGIGGSSDGKALALTAPSREGQILAIRRAYEDAGIRPSEIGLIEPHGTGTAVGDRTELMALSQVFWEDGTPPRRTGLGSLKSQIGHAKCAAGMASLIKAVCCVRHGVLPPTTHLKNPHRAYTSASPFAFRTEKAGYWREKRRVAGVSGFGFGGTNFHVVMENYSDNRPQCLLKSWPAELFLFTGDTPSEAEGLMSKVEEMLAVNDRLRMIDIAASLAARCDGKAVRYAIVAATPDELLSRMDTARQGLSSEFVFPLIPVTGKVAFLFPGQGSQRVNMAADLFNLFPEMRRVLNGFPEYEDILFPYSVFSDADRRAGRELITDTRNAQPLLGIVDMAIAELLEGFGVDCDVVAGHSYGELPALCFAGVLTPEDLPSLSAARAGAVLGAVQDDKGRMAAVMADQDELAKLLDGLTDVWPVNFNTPRQTAVAGTTAGMEALLAKAKEAGVAAKELDVACAFHSPLLAGADTSFSAAVSDFELTSPKLAVMSNTDAELYPDSPEGIKQRLAEHLVNAVKFTEEVENMYRDGVRVFIEAGPGRALTSMVAETLKDRGITLIQTERGDANGLTFWLQALAKYVTTGRAINIEKLFCDRDASLLDIDNPENNKKNGLIWRIDGKSVIPENTEALEIERHSHDVSVLSNWLRTAGTGEAMKEQQTTLNDQVIMAYLANMNAVIQDHRDVVLGYMGNPVAPVYRGPQVAVASPPMPAAQMPVVQMPVAQAAVAQAPAQAAIPAAADAAPLPVDEPAAASESSDGLLDIRSLSTEQITDIVYDIVSDKTGYPVDMLTPDTDLEADLSIDSIKKMEIIGGLRERVKMPENDDDMAKYFEDVISIRKFSDLTSWVEKLGEAEAGSAAGDAATAVSASFVADLGDTPTAADSAMPDIDAVLAKLDVDLTRLTYVETPCPLVEKDLGLVADKTFAVLDDGAGLATAVADKLTSVGATARILEANTTVDVTDCDGIVLVNSAAGKHRYGIMELFSLVKAADMSKLQWVLVFDDISAALLGAEHFKEAWDKFGLPEGFRGFLKTLTHEYPGKRFCTVQFETPFDAATFADIVVDELCDLQPLPEMFYHDNDRFFLLPEVNPLDAAASQASLVLDKDSVVVVLGGAQGISPRLVSKFAEKQPCQYVIVGRTADDPEFQKYATLQTVDEIRRFLIANEDIKQPKEIEAKAKRVYKAKQINKALDAIRQTGAKAEYLAADVTDATQMEDLFAAVKEMYGRIDGVIHAAGILEDKLFGNKEADSFLRVYNTKNVPLATIIDKLIGDLKLLVMFSSMSSAFGNAGQCDYAAGNSVMDGAARILKRKYPELRVVAFDWGPWGGAGMVDKGLENEFNKRGISLINLELGADFFANELTCGNEATVLAMAIEPQAITDLIDATFTSKH
ncbi:MAG: SDR family NAD(P)-dependent oxidoreductase [Actinomycetia bacterium]|nr:SDR family NAD(P)-dependent oxidoreductase [Actinomycetes bacterium]